MGDRIQPTEMHQTNQGSVGRLLRMQGKQEQLNAFESGQQLNRKATKLYLLKSVALQNHSFKENVYFKHLNFKNQHGFCKEKKSTIDHNNNYKNNTEEYLKLKSLSSPFLNPIPQLQPLAFVSLNHFVVSLRKHDRVLGDATSCWRWFPSGQAHPLTPVIPCPPRAGDSNYVIGSASL